MDVIYTIVMKMGLTNIGYIILILGIFIDITPKIKWNPIKSIIKYFGKWFNTSVENEIASFKEEVNTKFAELKQEQLAQRETLDKLIFDQENKEVSRLRWEIINFETSLQNNVKHSRQQYCHILDNAMKYQRMILQEEDYEDGENVPEVLEAIEAIKKHYEEHRGDQTALYF